MSRGIGERRQKYKNSKGNGGIIEEMNEEQQRIAIAEACGWTFEKKARCNMLSKEPAWHLISPEGKMKCGIEIWHETRYGKESNYYPFEGELVNYLDECSIPDYLNDLNAMHSAEKSLGEIERERYTDNICGITPCNYDGWFSCAHATAAQRAEAFLKTIGKWEDIKGTSV